MTGIVYHRHDHASRLAQVLLSTHLLLYCQSKTTTSMISKPIYENGDGIYEGNFSGELVSPRSGRNLLQQQETTQTLFRVEEDNQKTREALWEFYREGAKIFARRTSITSVT